MTRVLLAGFATLLASLLAAGFWTLGQAQYLNDYCQTRAPQPQPLTPEGLSGRPAYLDGPVTVRCEYDGLPAVVVTDPLPMIGALGLAGLVIMLVVLAFGWARRPAPS